MRQKIDPRIAGINPAFLMAKGIAPLAIVDGSIEAGMRDPSDLTAIASLKFATGLDVRPVPMTTVEMEGWFETLARLEPGQACRDRSETIELDDNALRVDRVGDKFALADRESWAHLREICGDRPKLVVEIASNSSLRVALPEYPTKFMALRHHIDQCSPILPELLAWSTPHVTEQGECVIWAVPHDWLSLRIAQIERELSPASLIILDQAGNRFDFRPAQLRPRVGTPTICALIAALAGLSLWGFDADRRFRAVAERESAAAIAPSGVPIAPSGLGMIGLPSASNSERLAVAPAASAHVLPKADAFQLIGIAGRLPDNAVALVRAGWGKTITLRKGDSLLGWTVSSIGADRVIFLNGSSRRELVLKPTTPA